MSAPSVCFLLDWHETPHNDNHLRLPRAFRSCGWKVTCASQTALCIDAGAVKVSEGGATSRLESFDLVWHLGLGRRYGFLDRMELLSLLPSGLLVTPAESLSLRHGKLHLMDPNIADLLPETYASADIDFLLSRISNGDWVIKPAAGSFGEEVMRVNGESPKLKRLLEQACAKHFVVAQRFIPLETTPEKRVLFAEGHVIGSYGRTPDDDQPGNLAKGAKACLAEIDSEIEPKVVRVGGWLRDQGVGFAAADFRAQHLIEINIANPGGLATIERLTGQDLTPRVVEQLARRDCAYQMKGDHDT